MHGTYIRLHKEKQAHQAEIQGLKVGLPRSAQRLPHAVVYTSIFPAVA